MKQSESVIAQRQGSQKQNTMVASESSTSDEEEMEAVFKQKHCPAASGSTSRLMKTPKTDLSREFPTRGEGFSGEEQRRGCPRN